MNNLRESLLRIAKLAAATPDGETDAFRLSLIHEEALAALEDNKQSERVIE